MKQATSRRPPTETELSEVRRLRVEKDLSVGAIQSKTRVPFNAVFAELARNRLLWSEVHFEVSASERREIEDVTDDDE